MKLIIGIAVVLMLCFCSATYAAGAAGHAGGQAASHSSGQATSHAGGHYSGHAGYTGQYNNNNNNNYYNNNWSGDAGDDSNSGDTGTYAVQPISVGSELAPTPASSRWSYSYVEPPSPAAVEAQAARDANFQAAVADWQARHGRSISE